MGSHCELAIEMLNGAILEEIPGGLPVVKKGRVRHIAIGDLKFG